jgi:hypothetical protein
MPVNDRAPSLAGMWTHFVPTYILPWVKRWRCHVTIGLNTYRLDQRIDPYGRYDQADGIRCRIRRAMRESR